MSLTDIPLTTLDGKPTSLADYADRAVLVAAGLAGGGSLTGFTLKSSSLLGYMVLLSSVAFGLWTVLLKFNRVGVVAVFNFLIPVFGTILSAIFLGESILESHASNSSFPFFILRY